MIVAVAGVGAAEGARGAAAALACAGVEADRAALLVEIGGREARPTLLASAAARGLEERLGAHLPDLRPAARGALCQLAAPAGDLDFAAVSAAATVARGAVRGGGEATAAVLLPAELLQPLLESPLGRRVGGVLLRAEIAADRHLLALAIRSLRGRGLGVGVLKRRLGWVVERRALFGALPAVVAASVLPRPLLGGRRAEKPPHGGHFGRSTAGGAGVGV